MRTRPTKADRWHMGLHMSGVVGAGKGSRTKPNPPMAHAQRARILVRFGRVKHMQAHLVFGLVSPVGKHW